MNDVAGCNLCRKLAKNINEWSFDHKLRYKECRIEWHDNMPSIDWMTQEECVEHEDFDQEVIRAARQAGYTAGSILVHLHDRDGLDSFEYELDVA